MPSIWEAGWQTPNRKHSFQAPPSVLTGGGTSSSPITNSVVNIREALERMAEGVAKL